MTDKPNSADNSDPSMEDILASIRRILNEDETSAPAAAPAEDPVAAPAEDKASADDDVLVLDQSMMVETPEPARVEPVPEPPPPPVMSAEPPPPDIPAPPPPRQSAPAGPAATLPELMAPETAAAAASSVGSLVRTLTAGRSTRVYTGGPTLEDIVRAELRPLLAEWLDANLPPIVERLVRIEIERVVGRSVP